MPGLPGLSLSGQHALAVVLFIVILWITNAMPTGASSLLMIGIVVCFMGADVTPAHFLAFWSADTMWFILVCFIFGAVVDLSGLGKRITVYVFSIRSLLLLDLGLLGVSVLFSILGMNASFPKLVLLFPLLTTVAAMSSMPKDDPYVRHLALMINVLANVTGTLIYTGFVINPLVAPLGGFTVNYATWFEWFFVPALVYTLVCFAAVYVLFPPRKGEHLNVKAEQDEAKKLGPISSKEKLTIAWLLIAIVLWSTSPLTHIPTGFIAVLVAALMLSPGIGVINFKDFVQKTDWNSVFMLMGILAIGSLGSTGFAGWIWGHILPKEMPHSPMLSLAIISALVEILHIPLGSVATSTALAVPSLADYANTLGVSRILTSFVTYMTITGQFFFVYQNAALVCGAAYGLWKPIDIFKYGAIMFFATPITFGVLLYPGWLYMGWIH